MPPSSTLPRPRPAVVHRERVRAFVRRQAKTHGALVKERRVQCDLNLAQVAELAGSSPQTIHKVERGQIVATDALRYAIAAALTCEVLDLFPVRRRSEFEVEVR